MISSNRFWARVVDGLPRVRVAHGAVSCGADLAETVQFGGEIGFRLGNGLISGGVEVGRAGQQVGVDGEGAAEGVEVIDETDRGCGWREYPELGRTTCHPIADRVE